MVEVLGAIDNLLDLSKAKLNLSTDDSFECEDKNCSVHYSKSINSNYTNSQRLHRHSNTTNTNTNNNNNNNNESQSLSSKRSSLLRLEDVSELQLDYKSGAVYNGKICDNLKYGKGTFSWPNGDKYIGEFKVNFRHGYGENIFLKIVFQLETIKLGNSNFKAYSSGATEVLMRARFTKINEMGAGNILGLVVM